VATAPGDVSDCHPNGLRGGSVADNPVDNRWASQEARLSAGNEDGRPEAPVRSPAWMDQASASTTTLTVVSTSACRCTRTSYSPTARKAPSPITTSDFSTGLPALVRASAMSRGPTEPYSLPSVEALA